MQAIATKLEQTHLVAQIGSSDRISVVVYWGQTFADSAPKNPTRFANAKLPNIHSNPIQSFNVLCEIEPLLFATRTDLHYRFDDELDQLHSKSKVCLYCRTTDEYGLRIIYLVCKSVCLLQRAGLYWLAKRKPQTGPI